MKEQLYRAARSAGLPHLVGGSAWRRNRLLILCYHGVALDDEHHWSPAVYMSAEQFRRRLETLRALRATVLTLDEAIERLYGGTLPPRAVVITFDDGFADFNMLAAPLLMEYGLPATLYLTTYYVERPLPVWNLLSSYMIWLARSRDAADLEPVTGTSERFDLRAQHGRTSAHHAFLRRWSEDTTENKDGALDALARCLGVEIATLRQRRVLQLMTPEEVRSVSRRGIDVQLHTHRHRARADEPAFVREIVENAAAITKLTGRTPSHLCFPDGMYDLTHLPWLRAQGVRSATTCEPGLATRESEPLLLPRLLDSASVSNTAFEAWVMGVAALGHRRGMFAVVS